MKSFAKIAIMASALAFAAPQAAVAQDEYPLKGAEWVEVTGISLEDGGGLAYANWLAGEWRKRMDYAVQQGWIQSYEIWSNTYPRKDESNLWLISRFPAFVSDDEYEAQGRKMREYMKRTIAQMQSESGDRAKYRTVDNEFLAKRLVWRN